MGLPYLGIHGSVVRIFLDAYCEPVDSSVFRSWISEQCRSGSPPAGPISSSPPRLVPTSDTQFASRFDWTPSAINVQRPVMVDQRWSCVITKSLGECDPTVRGSTAQMTYSGFPQCVCRYVCTYKGSFGPSQVPSRWYPSALFLITGPDSGTSNIAEHTGGPLHCITKCSCEAAVQTH